MYSTGKGKKMVRFALKPAPAAKVVRLAGNFTDWKPLGMARQKDGAFAASVKLPPGVYQYKFIVDGAWITDPDNDYRAANPYGSTNSVAAIGE